MYICAGILRNMDMGSLHNYNQNVRNLHALVLIHIFFDLACFRQFKRLRRFSVCVAD